MRVMLSTRNWINLEILESAKYIIKNIFSGAISIVFRKWETSDCITNILLTKWKGKINKLQSKQKERPPVSR